MRLLQKIGLRGTIRTEADMIYILLVRGVCVYVCMLSHEYIHVYV